MEATSLPQNSTKGVEEAKGGNQNVTINELVGTPNQGYLKRDSQIKREEDQGKIEFIVVKNDK